MGYDQEICTSFLDVVPFCAFLLQPAHAMQVKPEMCRMSSERAVTPTRGLKLEMLVHGRACLHLSVRYSRRSHGQRHAPAAYSVVCVVAVMFEAWMGHAQGGRCCGRRG